MSDIQSLLDTLLLPFESKVLAWPDDAAIWFGGARDGMALHRQNLQHVTCEQGFKPWADQLQAGGLHVTNAERDWPCDVEQTTPTLPADVKLILLLPPRQREQARALLARSMASAADGALMVAAMRNAEGARSGEVDFARLLGTATSLSKHKARVYWTKVDHARIDRELQRQWLAGDAIRLIADGRFLSRPGVFAWDRIDPASMLLMEHIPDDLHGRGADLGAGYGYLAAEIIARNPQVTALDLFEADQRALQLARDNLTRLNPDTRVPLGFHWHDVCLGVHGNYDFIVSNPPFHQGRADAPELGRAFIAAAANALTPAGRLFLVANRHLSYEKVLDAHFGCVKTLVQRNGFKVIAATAKRKESRR